jgi:putative FmdB family regulatory protein
MPQYEFQCQECRVTFKERRSFSQSGDVAVCPSCDSSHTKKVLSAVAFISNGGRSSAASTDSVPVPISSGGCGCGSCSCGAN